MGVGGIGEIRKQIVKEEGVGSDISVEEIIGGCVYYVFTMFYYVKKGTGRGAKMYDKKNAITPWAACVVN